MKFVQGSFLQSNHYTWKILIQQHAHWSASNSAAMVIQSSWWMELFCASWSVRLRPESGSPELRKKKIMWCGISVFSPAGEYRKWGCNTVKQLTEKAAEMSGGGLCPAEGWKLSTTVAGGQESQGDKPTVPALFESWAVAESCEEWKGIEVTVRLKVQDLKHSGEGCPFWTVSGWVRSSRMRSL